MDAERPFAATPHRLARARRDGDVVRAVEIVSLAAFAGAALATAACAPILASTFAGMLVTAHSGRIASSAFAAMLGIALLPATAAAAAGVSTGAFVAGGFALRAPHFDWSRVAPWKGVQRILSRETAVALIKALGGATLLGAGLFCALAALRAGGAGADAALLVLRMRASAYAICTLAIGAGVVLAVFDFSFQRHMRARRLRMSFEEMRRDLKESDGDSHVRGRRRRAHRELVRGSLTRIAEASFVVTNPTHLAVALAYRPPEIAVPQVVVRASAALAAAVKIRAGELGIPLVEDIALARALFASTRVDGFIPREQYDDVARIVAALARSGALRR